MKVIDLTHTIRENMPGIPRDGAAEVKSNQLVRERRVQRNTAADVHPHGDAYGSSGTYFFGENYAG